MVALTAPLGARLESAPLGRVALWLDDVGLVAHCRALLDEFAVDEAVDAAALERLSAGGALDLAIVSWRDELTRLAMRLGLRLVVLGDRVPEALVDAIGRGLNASFVARADALPAEVRRFTRAARAADAKRHQLHDATVRFRGAPAALRLGDLSNDGLSFLVEDADLEPLLPGSELGAVELTRDGVVGLDGVSARVRHVEPLGPGRYRVGCTLAAEAPPVVARATVLRDRALCAALLKAGAKSGIVIAPFERDERAPLELQLVEPRVEVAAGMLAAAGEHPLSELSLVRGRFEVHGRLYRFTSVVVQAEPLLIKLPATIEETQQRAAARYRVSETEPLLVELTSPLTGSCTLKPVIDLSSSGFSVAVDGTRELFPLGLRLGVVMRLPGGDVRADGCVRALLREGGRLRCGIELAALDEPSHARVCEFLLRQRAPAIGDGVGLPFARLADFFRATGFLPADKEAVLAPMMPQVQHTFEALYRRPSKLFKAVVARDGETVTGHVSVVRAYRHTGMSHHLAADSSRHVAHLLNISAAEYFGLSPDFEYGKIWFHADNKWPSRVFGGFARQLRDSSQSELRANLHLTLPTGCDFATAPDDLEIVEADARHLAAVEHYFVTRERGLLLRSDDLLRDALTLDAIDRQYGELGLFRKRRVLMALRRGQPLGFAFAEFSSPGLNLYETLSMFRMFVLPDGESRGAPVRVALLNALSHLYASQGRSYMRGIFAPSESDDYARLGFTSQERSFTWTWHRGLCPRFCDHVDRLFEALRRRAMRGQAGGAGAGEGGGAVNASR